MRRLLAAAALLLCLGALAVPGAGAAQRHRGHCHAVRGGGQVSIVGIRAHNLGCGRARRLLRHWLHHGFPRHQTGWYCDMATPVKLCAGGNGGGAPYVQFRFRG